MALPGDRWVVSCYTCGKPLFIERCDAESKIHRDEITDEYIYDEISDIFLCNECSGIQQDEK